MDIFLRGFSLFSCPQHSPLAPKPNVAFKVWTELWTEFCVFHISIRISEGLLYVDVMQTYYETVEWIHLAQDKVQQRACSNGVVLGEACSTHRINSEMEFLCRRLEELWRALPSGKWNRVVW
jgi:hypothetical protein